MTNGDDGLWAEQHEDATTRLTRIGDRLGDAFHADPEFQDDDKLIAFLDARTGPTTHEGGIAMFGYEDSIEALTDLLMHVRAIFVANGKGFEIVFLGPD